MQWREPDLCAQRPVDPFPGLSALIIGESILDDGNAISSERGDGLVQQPTAGHILCATSCHVWAFIHTWILHPVPHLPPRLLALVAVSIRWALWLLIVARRKHVRPD